MAYMDICNRLKHKMSGFIFTYWFMFTLIYITKAQAKDQDTYQMLGKYVF